jgi:hypothetical protein
MLGSHPSMMRQITKYQADKLINADWTSSISPVVEYKDQYFDVRGMNNDEVVESVKLLILLDMEGGRRVD